jgi:hypothetical protein
MALIPLIDCYELLDIDPKTVRTSLKRAGIALTPHPTDARIKCLTTEQIELLAAMHSRLLRPGVDGLPCASEGVTARRASSYADAPPEPAVGASPRTSQEDMSLFQKLAILETRVIQLSDHLSGLALTLLQQRDHSIERRISTLETVMRELLGRPISLPSLPDQEASVEKGESAVKSKSVRQLNPAEERARSRMPPLIEYSAQGTYVVVSAQEGELSLVADSREWFDWLATLSSFRFVGQAGRFTAYRDSRHGHPRRSWRAHRHIHQHNYKHSLGVTDQLTVTRLEQVAALLQAHVAAL